LLKNGFAQRRPWSLGGAFVFAEQLQHLGFIRVDHEQAGGQERDESNADGGEDDLGRRFRSDVHDQHPEQAGVEGDEQEQHGPGRAFR
jgi:hypothetical protein